jgi:hypothetical protein
MTSESRSLGAVLLAAAIATAIPLPARADPAADARARFHEGVRLFEAERYAEARAAFEEARQIVPSPRVLANIGACYDREGRPADAVRMYRRFLGAAGPDVPRSARRTVEREIARLRPAIGQLVLAIDPAGASVAIDGEVVDVAPLTFPLPVGPGDRLIEVRASGHVAFARTIAVEAGREIDLSVALQPVPPAPPPREPPPEPAVEAHAPVPPSEPALSNGPPPGPPVEPPLPPPVPLGRGPLLWSGLGLTGALGVAATVTGLVVLSARSEYADPATTQARRLELFDSTPTLADVTSVLIDAAIGFGLATLGLYLFAGPSEEPAE